MPTNITADQKKQNTSRQQENWLVVGSPTHLKHMLVKMAFFFPKNRGENSKKYLSCHHQKEKESHPPPTPPTHLPPFFFRSEVL